MNAVRVPQAVLTRTPRAPRAVLVASAIGVIVVVFFSSWISWGFGGPRSTQVFDDIATAVAALLTTAACLSAAIKNPRGARSSWAWLTAYTMLWAVGEMTWGYYEVFLHQNVPFPSLADIGYLGAVPFGVVAILTLRDAPIGRTAKARAALDGAIIAGALLFISWAFVLGPAFRASSGSVFEQTLSLAYPVADVVIGAMALAVLARSKSGGRTPLVLVVLGLLAMAIADGGYAYLSQLGVYGTTNVIDGVWIVGYMFLMVAAVAAPSFVAAEPEDPQAARVIPLTQILIPTCALGAAGIAAIGVELTRGTVGPFLFFTAASILVLSGLRQVLMFQENRSLNASLHETLAALRQREGELEHLAFHDPLTRLANRALFRDRVEHAIARGKRDHREITVLFVDLDDFKSINDTLGHAAGDELLSAFAERLRACMRPGDTVARLGGDEFGILLDNTPSEHEISSIATKVLQSTRVNFNVGGHEIRVTVSIGIGTNTVGADDAGSVLRSADIALYEAKGNGKNRYEVFHPDMGLNVLERVELRAALQQAIDQAQFRVAYQPIVNLRTGAVVAYEALLRWQHPVHGLLEPAMFLSTAIETGLILPIGRHVFDQAFAQAQRWNDGSRPDERVTVHVNLSPRELQSPTVVSDIAHALRTTGANPKTILIEITESAIIGDTELALEHLSAFKAMGLLIGLDDFGTGYSSLSYLRQFPVDVLKIDRCFIDDLDESDGTGKLLAAVIQLGHALGIATIAEGVETPTQVTWLRDLGCDSAQGYHFGRPELIMTALPAPEFSHRRP